MVWILHLQLPLDRIPGPSSVTSESTKSNGFKIYPTEESDDQLVTKGLVLGDFESAVALCLSSDQFVDAILLAVHQQTL